MKKVIIVGATSGIGEATAKLLLRNNYKTAVTGRRIHLLQKLKQEYPLVIIKTFDISEPINTVKCLNELAEELGGLDLIIISSATGFEDEKLDFEVHKDIINTNVLGFTCVADWAFNYFHRQGHGHLADITSVAGIKGLRFSPSYSASKSYQIKYLEALRQRSYHLKLPIYITDLRPGFVKTAMGRHEKAFWVATSETAAKQILSAINRKSKLSYITRRWRIIGGLIKIIPGFIFNRI